VYQQVHKCTRGIKTNIYGLVTDVSQLNIHVAKFYNGVPKDISSVTKYFILLMWQICQYIDQVNFITSRLDVA
jgi:hypothetical protein